MISESTNRPELEFRERYCLPKRERIYLKRSIEQVYTEGQAFLVYPLRVVYLLSTEPLPDRAQMMVGVGKKYFKRANKRNHLKRLVREAYRQNKHVWHTALAASGIYGRIAYSNVAKEMPTYLQVERAVCKSLEKIIARESLFLSSREPSHLLVAED